jgi:hypothetical protein
MAALQAEGRRRRSQRAAPVASSWSGNPQRKPPMQARIKRRPMRIDNYIVSFEGLVAAGRPVASDGCAGLLPGDRHRALCRRATLPDSRNRSARFANSRPNLGRQRHRALRGTDSTCGHGARCLISSGDRSFGSRRIAQIWYSIKCQIR